MAVSGTSWTLLANGSVRSSPMLSTARKTSPISVDPIGVARTRDSTSAIGSSTPNTRRKRFGKHRDRKRVVWGKSVAARVELGGRRIIKTKKKQHDILRQYNQVVTTER